MPCTLPTRRSVSGKLSLVAAVLLLAACAAAPADVEGTVEDYIEALAQRDLQRVMDLYAPLEERLKSEPAARHEEIRGQFHEYLQARYAEYETAKDTGKLEFQPDGVVLSRALNLGRGVYYETIELRLPAPDRALLVSEVRLAYRSIDMAALPAGTTVYLLGAPVGTIYNPVIGEGQPAVRRLLEKAWLRWTLVKSEGAWRVVSVEPDPDRPPESYTDTTRF